MRKSGGFCVNIYGNIYDIVYCTYVKYIFVLATYINRAWLQSVQYAKHTTKSLNSVELRLEKSA